MSGFGSGSDSGICLRVRVIPLQFFGYPTSSLGGGNTVGAMLRNPSGPRERHGTIKENITLTMSRLISWSEQIASGMSYLSSKKVVHGDLACR